MLNTSGVSADLAGCLGGVAGLLVMTVSSSSSIHDMSVRVATSWSAHWLQMNQPSEGRWHMAVRQVVVVGHACLLRGPCCRYRAAASERFVAVTELGCVVGGAPFPGQTHPAALLRFACSSASSPRQTGQRVPEMVTRCDSQRTHQLGSVGISGRPGFCQRGSSWRGGRPSMWPTTASASPAAVTACRRRCGSRWAHQRAGHGDRCAASCQSAAGRLGAHSSANASMRARTVRAHTIPGIMASICATARSRSADTFASSPRRWFRSACIVSAAVGTSRLP